MLDTNQIIFVGLVPLLLVPLLAWVELRRRKQRGELRWSPGLGVGAALAIAYGFALQWPPLPPRQSVDWLAYVAGALALVALADAIRPLNRTVWTVLILALLAATSYLLVRPLLAPGRPTVTEGWTIAAVGLVAGVIWWIAGAAFSRRSDARTTSGVWFLTAAAVAMVMMLSGSQKIGMIAGAPAAAMAGLLLTTWLRPRLLLHPGALVPLAVLLTGVLIAGRAWITPAPPLWQMGLIFIAPLLPWVVELTPARRWQPMRRTALALVLTAIPLLIVQTAAVVTFNQRNTIAPYYY